VLGFGDYASRPNPRLIVECRSLGLNIEALATEQACATFNFLASEGRCVAAAMIPPFNMRVNEDDVARTKFQRNKLIDSEYENK
jgi:NADH dehydrogenase [ubiquinone] 1 alpha subcomplex assembly factor 3